MVQILRYFFRGIALSVILIRAGLGLDPVALRRLSVVVFRLAFLPCSAEAIAVSVASHFFLDFPWVWGYLLGYEKLCIKSPFHNVRPLKTS